MVRTTCTKLIYNDQEVYIMRKMEISPRGSTGGFSRNRYIKAEGGEDRNPKRQFSISKS